MPIKFVGESFCVSKEFWYRKVSSEEGGIFLISQDRKTSPENHSVFQKNSGREKYFMDRRGGGGITIFRRSFCLSVPKNFIGEHFGVSEKFFHRKFSCIGGGASWSLSKFFVSQDRNEKLCEGILLFSGSFLVSKKIYA